MISKNYKNILGLLCIALGIFLFISFAGDLVFRIFGIALSLWIIQYGLSLQGTNLKEVSIKTLAKFKSQH